MNNSDPERAENWLKQTTQLLSSNLRAGNTRVLTAQIRLTDCLVQLQKFEEAEAFLLLVLEYTGDRDDETYTTIKNKHNKHFYTLGMRSEFNFPDIQAKETLTVIPYCFINKSNNFRSSLWPYQSS